MFGGSQSGISCWWNHQRWRHHCWAVAELWYFTQGLCRVLSLHTSLSICAFQCDFSIGKFMAPISKCFQILCRHSPLENLSDSEQLGDSGEMWSIFYLRFGGGLSQNSRNSALVSTVDRQQKAILRPEKHCMWPKPASTECGRERSRLCLLMSQTNKQTNTAEESQGLGESWYSGKWVFNIIFYLFSEFQAYLWSVLIMFTLPL